MSFRISHTSIRLVVVAACAALVALAITSQPAGLAAPSGETTLHARYAVAGPVSKVVFGAQTMPLKFSHRKHLERSPLACTYCHERADDSVSAVDNLLPTEADCATCHAIDRSKHEKQVAPGKAPARCLACHARVDAATGFVPRMHIPVPNLKFNHKAHVARNIACKTCHGDMRGVDLATRKQLPKMALCLTCHNGRKTSGACTMCHLASPGGVMRTKFVQGKLAPSGSLRGSAHNATFAVSHRAVAQSNSRFCANCHRKSYCANCHNGVRKPMRIHANDYVATHVIDAKRNSPNCSGCHRIQSFCVGCHSRSGVVDDGRGSQFMGPSTGMPRRYHPVGWVIADENGVTRGKRGLTHHSWAAQRNIRQCAACHRDEFCTKCHSNRPGAFARVNPHPRNWRNSRRCRALKRRSGRMCLRCHITPGEARCNYMATP